jgi:hypothetical protein
MNRKVFWSLLVAGGLGMDDSPDNPGELSERTTTGMSARRLVTTDGCRAIQSSSDERITQDWAAASRIVS